MKPAIGGALAAFLLLSACENNAAHEQAEQFAVMDDTVSVSGSRQRQDGFVAEAPAPSPGDGATETAPAERLMAYEYGYQIETPSDATGTLLESHRSACEAAGTDACQVMSANLYERSGDNVSGQLVLRAAPAWIATFRDGLEAEIEAAEGRLRNQNQTATDLTATIVDAEARLEAKRVLRTRLTSLLEREDAAVEELVAVERELARVQGDIEGSEARLRALRGRVAMSTLTLNYSSRIEPVSAGALDPLGRALRNVFGNMAEALASVITFIAFALPWLIVIIPLFWLAVRGVRYIWRRRKPA